MLIRRIADKVIDAYRTLLNNRRLIGEGRRELNYAERVAQELLPQYRLDIQKSEAECNRVSRLIGEEQENMERSVINSPVNWAYSMRS